MEPEKDSMEDVERLRNMNTKFWKNKKVLVTGFEGFLGSNLTRVLSYLGASVIGLDILVKRKETLLVNSDYKAIKVIKGSVTNYNLLKSVIKKNFFPILTS